MRVPLLIFVLLAACSRQGSSIPDPSLEGEKTWYGVIGPLVQTRCAICHQAGDIAPFPFESYDQVKVKLDSIKVAVETKRMPPFPPDQSEASGCPRIDDVRRMSDAEREVLLAWVNDGAPEGDARMLPATPKNEPLGPPTDSWSMTEEYNSEATTEDDYRCFLIEPTLVTQISVGAVSVTPGNRQVVHHSAVYLIPPEQVQAVRDLDAKEAGIGYSCFGGVGITEAYPTGLWVPGNDAPLVPPHGGVGYYLMPGWAFVVSNHYNYKGGKKGDKSTVTLWRADYVITEVPHAIIMGETEFTIPPNTMDFTVSKEGPVLSKGSYTTTYNEGLEGKMYSVWGHQHQKGKSFEMDLVRADGTKQCLLHIARWDFNWQSIYKLKDFVVAKPGDKVTVKCVWDNPAASEVKYGENTDDEMCFGSIALLDNN